MSTLKSIYCCGSYGNVGWVKGWEFDQTDHTRVTDVELTLNHHRAYKFSQAGTDPQDFARVTDYLSGYDLTFRPCVFTWEDEP